MTNKLQEKTGLYKKVTNKVYHSDKRFVSSSVLKNIYVPNSLGMSYSSEAMNFGTLVHLLTYEPEELMNEFIVYDEDKRPEPDKNFGSKLNKAWKQELHQLAEQKGLTMISVSDYDDAKALASKISSTAFVSEKLHKKGLGELSGVWQDNDTGVWCKIRPDFVPTNIKGSIVDLKTYSGGDLDKIGRIILDRKYHLSAAMYLEGMTQITGKNYDRFFFVFAETSGLNNVTCVELGAETIEEGRLLFKDSLMQYKHVKEEDLWDEGYCPSNECVVLDIPNFGFKHRKVV